LEVDVDEGGEVEIPAEDEEIWDVIVEEVLDVEDIVAEKEDLELELEDPGCTSSICSELNTNTELPGDLSSKCIGAVYGISELTVLTNHLKLDVAGFVAFSIIDR
jgi:hypothetical protein